MVAVSWVVCKNKEDRDRISKGVMEDPQFKEQMDPSKMPVDGKRMFWGAFETVRGTVEPVIRPERRRICRRRTGKG